VVVTGADAGVGRTIVRKFVCEGCGVCLSGVTLTGSELPLPRFAKLNDERP